MDTTARTLRLLSLLQTHRFWPGGELAERLGISSRTLRRDVDRLRELGYTVDATPGAAGGYRLAVGANLPPLLLEDDEAVALAVGLRVAAGAAISGIEDSALRALAKLEAVLPERLRRRVAGLHGNVAVLRWGGADEPTVDPDVLSVLAQGCRDREEVRFDYRRRDDEESARLVQPHQLVAVGRRWYLVAWDVRRDDWRTFRLDRMTAPRPAGARFTPRTVPGGDAADFVARSLRAASTGHSATVRVDAPPGELEAVARWLGTEARSTGDGATEVELRAETRGWLAAMVADLAVRFDVAVAGDAELAEILRATGARLVAAGDAPAPDGAARSEIPGSPVIADTN